MEKASGRAAPLLFEHRQSIYRRTDRLFAGLMLFQWLAAIAAAVWISPRAWFNLMSADYAFQKPFHAIFCRNVMIYFEPPARRGLIAALYRHTAPGGYLFTGHAETIPSDAAGYRSIRPSVYQRPEH